MAHDSSISPIGMALALTVALAGCNGDGDGNTGPGSTATNIQAVSGDAQTGDRTTALGAPFVVSVTDADGDGVSGVTVTWQVTSGQGTLSATSVTTDADGEASVTYTLGHLPGDETVTASVSGLTGSPVTFTATAEYAGPITVDVDMQGIAFVAPDGSDAVTVVEGDAVRWENFDAEQHTATSTAAPAGGSSFDSGLLNTGGSFQFTTDAQGTWTYFCEVHPTIMLDATITALAVP